MRWRAWVRILPSLLLGGGKKIACSRVDVDPRVMAELRWLLESIDGVSKEANRSSKMARKKVTIQVTNDY
jgi:hypothetical protein